MGLLCIICLIGVLIYVLYYKKGNDRGQLCGGNRELPDIPVSQQEGSLAGTAAYTQEFGPVIYYANDRHGKEDREYRFQYRLIRGSWRAYILRTPNFNRKAKDSSVHILRDKRALYICWSGTVQSVHDIQVISKQWADNIQEYLSTGRRF